MYHLMIFLPDAVKCIRTSDPDCRAEACASTRSILCLFSKTFQISHKGKIMSIISYLRDRALLVSPIVITEGHRSSFPAPSPASSPRWYSSPQPLITACMFPTVYR